MKDFEILNKKRCFSGFAFNVESVEARLPNGKVRNYDLVDHKECIALVPVDQQQNICFVRQYRIGAEKVILELPAGVIEDGEAPETCAAREIREEIGMSANGLTKIGQFFLTPGYCNEFMHIYLATGLSDSPLAADEDEFLDIVKLPVKTVYEMASRGEFEDSKTLAALLLAQPKIFGDQE
jgi:ADP-ribose pyrophosphatase